MEDKRPIKYVLRKIYVNDTMKDKVKKAYDSLVIEEFTYGA